MSLEMELLFCVTQPCTRPIDRLASVGQSCRLGRAGSRGGRRTKRWMDRAPDFLEIKSSERASEPVSPSVNQARNPLCKPVLSSRPRSLGPRPSLSSPHSSAHDSKSAATSIHPSDVRRSVQGRRAQELRLRHSPHRQSLRRPSHRSSSGGLLSNVPGESGSEVWTISGMVIFSSLSARRGRRAVLGRQVRWASDVS